MLLKLSSGSVWPQQQYCVALPLDNCAVNTHSCTSNIIGLPWHHMFRHLCVSKGGSEKLQRSLDHSTTTTFTALQHSGDHHIHTR
jgi:hypothetical protein